MMDRILLPSKDAWTRARDRYVEDLSDDERTVYHNSSLESIFYSASATEKMHGESSTGRKFMAKLQPFVDAIDQYSQAVDVYSNAYPLVLSPLWGSIRVVLHVRILFHYRSPIRRPIANLIIQLAREFGKYFEKIVDMFAQIGDVLPRFRVYENLFPDHERLTQALSGVYFDIIVFCAEAKGVFRRGKHFSGTQSSEKLAKVRTNLAVELSAPNLRAVFKLTWKPFEREFGEIITRFRKHQKSVEQEAGLSHMIEAANSRELVHISQKQIAKLQQGDYFSIGIKHRV